MPLQRPKALLFDLGGVLVDFDFNRAIAAWAEHSTLSVNELRARFKYDREYEQHEMGEIDSQKYFSHLASVLELDASLEDIELGWNSIFISEIIETRLLVQSQRRIMPCFAFTNTNAPHKATWSHLFPGVLQAFDQIFSSHELQLRKPDPVAFMRISELTQTRPEDFMFFDDLLENVQAARALGFQSVLVRSPQDVVNSVRSINEVG